MKWKAPLLLALLTLCGILLTGCWNYREVDELAIVAGLAIDRGTNKQYQLTAEVIKISGGKDMKNESIIVSSEGDTIFAANQRMISTLGSRLFWSHAQVIIISEPIAREGVVNLLDWYLRDSETRSDVNIIISKEKTAKEILENKEEQNLQSIKSYKMEETIRNEKVLAESPHVELWEFANYLKRQGISAVAPAVSLQKVDNGKVAAIKGAAVFKADKLLGYLDDDETKTLIMVKDKLKQSDLVIKEKGKEQDVLITLEIFRNKTKIKPEIKNGKIKMLIDIDLVAAINEIEGTEDFMKEDKARQLEKDIGNRLKNDIEGLVKKVQKDFGSDIFGFGAIVYGYNSREWKKIRNDWDKYFKELTVEVRPKVLIKGSSIMSESVELGD